MTNLAQFLLIVVILTLTFLIAIVAVQVFQILHEAKLAVKKFNQLLENTHYLSNAAAAPIQSMNQFFTQIKSLVKDTENEVIGEASDRVMTSEETTVSTNPKPPTPSRHVFHRAGQMLRPRN